jgi:glyoxylase-like metal-dependent hydrolase (beta-lactamase superfamily II)
MALTFDRSFDARPGEPVAVAPGVRRVTAPNPGPFTFTGTNTFLIGDEDVAVLDPGPDDPAHVEAIVSALGGGRVAHILVSHTHRDHSPAARLLQARTGAPILAAGPHRTARPPRPGEEARLDAAADTDFAPDATLADGDVVEGGSYRLQAIATPGHTANHLAFALLGGDLLFPGDHVMSWSTTVVAPPDGAMADYMASLDRLQARPERLYLPAHGAEIRDPQAFIRGLKAHRRMRERAILERLAQGDRLIAELVGAIYREVDPRLRGAAALSTLAHLEDLVARGAAASDSTPSLASRYWPAAGRP